MAAQQSQSQLQPQPPPHRDLNPDDYEGLQVVDGGGLEVVGQRHGLSQNKTFEQHSNLPEISPPSYPEVYDPYKNSGQPGQHPALLAGGYAGEPTPTTGIGSPEYSYLGGRNPYDQTPQEKPTRTRICGLKKRVFWIVLAIGIFIVVVAVAVGLGMGLATRNSSAAASNTTTPTTTSNSTSTNTLPAATATSTLGAATIACPSANKTLYEVPTDTSRKFLVLCGRDYSETGGAADLYSMNITTFAACLDECAGQEGCAAVGWGNYYGTNTCWLKSQIGEPNWSRSWYAAVEDDSG